MATHSTLSALFTDIANAIRTKTGGSSSIVADNFPTEINSIVTDPTGGMTATNDKILSGYTARANYTNLTGTVTTYAGSSWQPGNELCFTALTAGSTISMYLSDYAGPMGSSFEYTTDGNWHGFTRSGNQYETITLTNIGDKVYFRGNNPTGVSCGPSLLTADGESYQFQMTGSIAASGNVMSLIDNGACTTTTIPNDYCFWNLFCGCAALVSPPDLPATTLTSNCYKAMFLQCTSLYVSDTSGTGYTTAWKIPADSTATGDYSMTNMFTECLGTRAGGDSPNFNGTQLTYYTSNPLA